MAPPFIRKLDVEGLKGATGSYELSRLNVVTGPNGAGKTRLRDAIDFLLGRDVAGEGVDGRNLRQLLAGSRMRVRAIVVGEDGRETEIVRMRELGQRGAFGESRLLVNGREEHSSVAMGEVLGRTSAPGGAAWLDLSPERVLAALAVIGAGIVPDAVGDARKVIEVYNGGAIVKERAPVWPSNPEALLETAAKFAKEELNAARREKREISGSTDRSRSAVTTAIDPALVAARRAAVDRTSAERDRLAQDYAAARARVDAAGDQRLDHERTEAALRQRIDDATQREVTARSLAASAPLAGPHQAEVDQARKKRDDLSRELAAANEAHKAAKESKASTYEVLVQADRRKVGSDRDVRTAAANLADATRRAGLLGQVPCTASTCWVDANELPPEEGPVENDLPGKCPLLAEARTAQASISDLEEAKARATERLAADEAALSAARAADTDAAGVVEKAQAKVTLLLEAFDRARIAFESVSQRAALASSAEVEHARASATIEAAAAEKEAATKELEDHLLRVDQLAATYDEAVEGLEAAEAAFLAAKKAAEDATEAMTSAVRQNTQHERYLEDRAAEERAEKRLEDADALVAQVDEVANRVLGAGVKAVVGEAARFIPSPWRIDFREGRVGLVRADEFWSGPGLSAAQRALLALALDSALDAIQRRRYRLATVELDQVDHDARARVLEQLRASVEAGDTAQVLAMLWRDEDAGRPYLDGWTRIAIRSERSPRDMATAEALVEHRTEMLRGDVDPFAPLPASEGSDGFDPFADSDQLPLVPDPREEIRKMISGLPGPALSGLLTSLGAPSVPKKLEDRRAKVEVLVLEQGLSVDAIVVRLGELARGQPVEPEAGRP